MEQFKFSSMFIEEKIQNTQELVDKYGEEQFVLVFDTNICIYIRQFYNNPIKFKNRNKSIYNSLINLLQPIIKNKSYVYPDLGIQESSRSKKDFTLNKAKEKEMKTAIKTIISMNLQELNYFAKTLKFKKPIKDNSKEVESKIAALEKNNVFKNMLPLLYACSLKLYELEVYSNISRVDKMKKLIDFMDKKVDCFLTVIMQYGYHYFNGVHKKIIQKKEKSLPKLMHNIWNASIDLSFPYLANFLFDSLNKTPVFVTNDKRLHSVIKGLNIKVAFANKSKLSGLPQGTEIDLSSANWGKNDIETVHNYYKKVHLNRGFLKQKFKCQNKNYMIRLCRKLENNIKINYES